MKKIADRVIALGLYVGFVALVISVTVCGAYFVALMELQYDR